MRPEGGPLPLGLGKRTARPASMKAREHLTTAMTLYREMAMGFWLEKAEAALEQAG
jgi:hypothetical protein